MLHEAWLRWTDDWHVAAQHAGIVIIPHGNVAALDIVTDVIDGLTSAVETFDNRLFIWRRSTGRREIP